VVLQGDEAQLGARVGLFGHSANLDVGHVESLLSPFGDSVSFGAR
jgi:hypothetical protein